MLAERDRFSISIDRLLDVEGCKKRSGSDEYLPGKIMRHVGRMINHEIKPNAPPKCAPDRF